MFLKHMLLFSILLLPLFQPTETPGEGEAEEAKAGERPATPRSAPSETGPRTPRGETPQRQDTSASRGVTPHGLVTDGHETDH